MYKPHHVKEVDRLVVDIIIDFLQIRRNQIRCYLFEKDALTRIKDGFYLVFTDVVVGKEMKRRVLGR